MGCIIWERYVWIFLGLMTIFLVPMCRGTTDPRDVFAINSLYAALGFPILPGWMPFGGDLCADGWQGVQCVNANITGIVLTGANLGGELGNDLGNFSSIIQIDLSNNHIGGSIPSNLPITMRTFFLSGNQFTGSIPENLSALGQLSDLSFNDNHLTGEIPDAFQQLMGLINLDLSGNNLSGQLPPSMGNLSSLTTLHLQNNQLVGVLDVLQDLPLTDLNIENNLFSGPIPDKLLNVPNFRRDGNSFNTTVIPSPPALSPLPSSPVAPSPALTPGKPAFGPSAPKITRKPASKAPNSVTGAKSSTTKRVTWIAIGGLVIVIVLAIGLCFCMSRYCKRSQPVRKFAQNHETGAYNDSNEKPRNNESLPKLYSPIEKGHKEAGLILRPPVRYGKDHERSSLRLQSDTEQEDNKRMAAIPKKKGYHEIDMSGLDEDTMSSPRPPPPPPFLPVDKITANPILQCNESLNGTEGTNSVKVVNGVAVVQGRTRSLVEWFERRERLNSDEVQAPDTTPQIRLETAKISLMLNGHPQITERELTSANDGNVAEGLMQNSRLTKLQLIEPYGTGIVPTQNNRSEQKCDLQESSLAKVGRQRRNASNFRCPSPDYETKEIKNIYVDSNESFNGTEGTNSVKVVNGVAVVQGRTRSLVERLERRERLNSDEVQAPDTTPQIRPETAKISLMLNGHPQITERELTSTNDGNFAEGLMQNHDVFLSTLRSRLTQLQVVRHFLEQNNIKGAIDATRKLPDHSVQADLISILMEKTEILTLDLFSCLLPVLLGLLDSKMERHASISLEMLLKLVAVFGPVVHSTISASPAVGVDLHAEQRLECCNQCFIQLQKIQKYLPVLVRRGDLLAKSAQALDVVLQNS